MSDTTEKPLLVHTTKKVSIDLHFNRKSLEDSSVPPWVIHCKGETYYVNSCVMSNSTTGRTIHKPGEKTSAFIRYVGILTIEGLDARIS